MLIKKPVSFLKKMLIFWNYFTSAVPQRKLFDIVLN